MQVILLSDLQVAINWLIRKLLLQTQEKPDVTKQSVAQRKKDDFLAIKARNLSKTESDLDTSGTVKNIVFEFLRLAGLEIFGIKAFAYQYYSVFVLKG